MGFLIPPELLADDEKTKNGELSTERIDIQILANAKRMDLSFAELNEFRLRDYIEYTNAYLGKEKKTKRNATQDDIDKLLA